MSRHFPDPAISAPAIAPRRQREPVSPGGGLIGPNAVTRMAAALREIEGDRICAAIFAQAGIGRYLQDAPDGMIDERDVAALQRATFDQLGAARADGVSRDAGRRTGDYLLAHRIPHPAQTILRHLPRGMSARLLVRAIARHAWTFAGSGAFTFAFDPGLELRIEASPLCRLIRREDAACSYYAATFERIFAAMLGPRSRVTETSCAARGDARCCFRVVY
jgi:divinyl protochlorophyllide a 8-vinyl-reductase